MLGLIGLQGIQETGIQGPTETGATVEVQGTQGEGLTGSTGTRRRSR
jgi:hypothetical protein